MSVLVVTHTDDYEAVGKVLKAIEEQGGKAFRFNTDRFPTDDRLAVELTEDGERLRLATDHEEVNLGEVSAVWYRRLRIGGRLPETMDRQWRQSAVHECRAVVHGMIISLNAFHFDPLPATQLAQNKQLQLQVARRLGLQTPRTLISNDPEAVRAFARTCPNGMITKMLSSFAIKEGDREKVVYTNPVKVEDLDDLQGLRYCPMTFQERIPKTLELRTTIVGKRVFTASIDSQSSERGRHDWRRDLPNLRERWTPYDLPADVEKRLLLLLDHFGLNYGAIDMIVTPDGRHVFLEVNPVGEYYWLELFSGFPISQAIADILLDPACRRVEAGARH